jgi:hypothetical protein
MAALAAALLDWPYDYYVLLRVLVCGVCIYLAVQERDVGRMQWAWVLGGVAVLYNPVLKIHLDRQIWTVINMATIALFAIHMWSIGPPKGDRHRRSDQ